MTRAHDARLGDAETQDEIIPPQRYVAVAPGRGRAGLLSVRRVPKTDGRIF